MCAAWFALQTRARCESTVRDLLTAKGYDCFLPSYKRKKIWSDRVVEKELPLFPSYLFCRFDLHVSRGMGRVLTTPGVWKILNFGGNPVAVCDREIEALQKVIAGESTREPWVFVPFGARVRLESGPLKGVEGVSVTHRGCRKLLLSVSLLQRSVLVGLDAGVAVSVLDSSPIVNREPLSDMLLRR
jgi:transcription antitermination factor NusG